MNAIDIIIISFAAVVGFLLILTVIILYYKASIVKKQKRCDADESNSIKNNSLDCDTNWRRLELNLVASEPPIYGYYDIKKNGALHDRDEKDNTSGSVSCFPNGRNVSRKNSRDAGYFTSDKKSKSNGFFGGEYGGVDGAGGDGGGGDCDGGGGDCGGF